MLLELSYSLSESIPVYPGSPLDSFKKINVMNNGDPCNTSVIHHYIHAGTHVDAPFHFDNEGLTIDMIPISDFIFSKPLLIECPLNKSGLISVEQIKEYEQVYSSDIIFFHTGYCSHREDGKVYADDFPALSEEAALFLRNELPELKAVAIDTLSIESSVLGPKQDFPVHRALLDKKVSRERTLLIYEDVNTGLLLGCVPAKVYGFPLRLSGLDGSPVTIAVEVAE